MAPPLPQRDLVLVFGVVMVAMLLPAFNIMAITTALPVIVGELGGLADLSWVVTAYLLTATVSVPLYGKVSDLYGRRPLIHVAIVIFITGSILAGSAQTMGHLIISRGIQGIGGGGLMALSQAIIGDAIPPRDRGKYQGYIGIVFAVASIAGPLAGGFFVDRLSWRWIFFVSVPLGVTALVIASRYLRIVHQRREHRIDYAGAALLTLAGRLIQLQDDPPQARLRLRITPLGQDAAGGARVPGVGVIEKPDQLPAGQGVDVGHGSRPRGAETDPVDPAVGAVKGLDVAF